MPPLKPYVPSFLMIYSLGHSPPTSKREGSLIDRATPGPSLISTARVKLRANAPCPKPKTCLQPLAGWMRSALLATLAANAGRLSEREQRLLRRIAISGSVRLATVGMDDIGRNCVRASRPSVDISLYTSVHRTMPYSGLMVNMVLGPCSRISLASPL